MAVELAEASLFIIIGLVVGVAIVFILMQSRVSRKAEQLVSGRRTELEAQHAQRMQDLDGMLERRNNEINSQFEERRKDLEGNVEQRRLELDTQYQQRLQELDKFYTEKYGADFETWKSEFMRENDEKTQELIKVEKQKALNVSRVVLKGKTAEQMAPLFPEFMSKYVPSDARFIGSPIDFIVFKNLHTLSGDAGERKEVEVVFVEVKAGNSKALNPNEKAVKAAIDNLRVKYDLMKLSLDNGANNTDVNEIDQQQSIEEAPDSILPLSASTDADRLMQLEPDKDDITSNNVLPDTPAVGNPSDNPVGIADEGRAVMETIYDYSSPPKVKELCPRCKFGLKCDCKDCPNCPNNYVIENDSPEQ